MKKDRRSLVWGLLVLIGLLHLGCSGSNKLVDLQQVPEQKCIVFGKMTLIDGGEPLRWDSVYADKDQNLIILSKASSSLLGYRIDGEGYFFWALDPGEYEIVSMAVYGTKPLYPRKSMIRLKFTVPDKVSSVCIGELVFFAGKRSYGSEVHEDCPDAVDRFKKRFPMIGERPAHRPMEVVRIGGYRKIQPICREFWGIGCGKKESPLEHFYFYGIRPVTPHTNIDAPASIETRLPLFEWEPSSVPDIKYDLIVYESAIWRMNPVIETEFPGEIVLYQEGLDEPRYQTTSELKPSKTYYWTVRLRKDDTVTSWSRYSFKTFYYYGVEAKGQLFRFSTPPHGPGSR